MKQNIEEISILNKLSEYQFKSDSIQVFTSHFFSPKNCDTSKLDKLTKQTFSIHHFRGSWFPLNMRLNRFVWKHLSHKQARFVQNCYQKTSRCLVKRRIKPLHHLNFQGIKNTSTFLTKLRPKTFTNKARRR